jgi:hypothetical protein
MGPSDSKTHSSIMAWCSKDIKSLSVYDFSTQSLYQPFEHVPRVFQRYRDHYNTVQILDIFRFELITLTDFHYKGSRI